MQSCAPAGGCADCVRRVRAEFVGTGDSVSGSRVWQCVVVLHPYLLCVGWAWVDNPCVPPGTWRFRMLFGNGNSASQARGWALDPAPQVHRPVPPAQPCDGRGLGLISWGGACQVVPFSCRTF
jgi:hypothetical protein